MRPRISSRRASVSACARYRQDRKARSAASAPSRCPTSSSSTTRLARTSQARARSSRPPARVSSPATAPRARDVRLHEPVRKRRDDPDRHHTISVQGRQRRFPEHEVPVARRVRRSRAAQGRRHDQRRRKLRFLLTAIDGDVAGGGGADKFRIKISDKSSGLVVYDNQMGAAHSADPTTVISSGGISIKR